MSSDKGSKDKPKSDGASSDICIVDEDSPNSSGETAWKRSSPATSINRNTSPTFIHTPSPISSPSPEKPVSRLKRIIRAPSQPNSPKRLNREIKSAIGKLRPINKFKFEEPTSNTPITKFSESGAKFSACGTSTPRRSAQVRIPKSKSKSNSIQAANNIQILENIVLNKAPNMSVQEQQTTKQILNDLQEQRRSLQNKLNQVEEHFQQKQIQSKQLTPPLPQTQQLLHSPSATTKSHRSNAQHTPPSTPSPKSSSQNPLLTPPQITATPLPPSIAQQQKSFEHQFKIHIAKSKNASSTTHTPRPRQTAYIPWATQIEKQQQKLEQIQTPAAPNLSTEMHPANLDIKATVKNTPELNSPTPLKSTKQTEQIPSPKSLRNKASTKIPSVYIPHIASIDRLTSMIDRDPNSISYTTTTSQEGGVRVKCKDTDSYNNLLQLLQKENVLLHTHQKAEDKGLRIIIRNLHASTSSNTIRCLLSTMGYNVKYINVLKNRFTGIPLNIFEAEIDSKSNPQAEQILSIKRLGNQEVTIERQAMRTDPVQCHRCQAFGHSKNYCRRAFVCLKCAGPHPSTDCKKDKNTPGRCANCGNQHIASYKGCPVYKSERAKLLSVKLSIPPPTQINNPPTTSEQCDLPLPPQIPESMQKDMPLPSDQLIDINKPNLMPTYAKRQNWQPLYQIANSQQANSPAHYSHNPPNKDVVHTQILDSNVNKHKTYSQVAYEATVNNPFKSSIKRHTPAPLKITPTTQSHIKHSQYHQRQLQQQLKGQQAQKVPPSQQIQTRYNEPIRQDHNDSQQFKDLKLAVAKNELTISKLSEKVDLLLKLINDHFKPSTLLNSSREN